MGNYKCDNNWISLTHTTDVFYRARGVRYSRSASWENEMSMLSKEKQSSRLLCLLFKKQAVCLRSTRSLPVVLNIHWFSGIRRGGLTLVRSSVVLSSSRFPEHCAQQWTFKQTPATCMSFLSALTRLASLLWPCPVTKCFSHINCC